jgi:hypothetical protein
MTSRALLFAFALAGCTQSGTGVELLVDPAGLTIDRLQIAAAYDTRNVTHTVDVAATSTTLDVIAQLPDEATTVTFDVSGFAAGQLVGHGVSDPIAVTPHHLAQASITLAPGGGTDGFTGPPDLVDGGALWSHQQGALPPSAGTVRGLWASSGTDVYAVGTATAGANVFHSTNHGATWASQLAGGSIDLNAVGGTSSSDVYLVGDNATILHGSGTTWAPQTSPAPAATRLLAIWAIAAGDIYIAGGGNTVMHSSTGGSWVTQTAVGTTELRGVWGVAGHIWAVGSAGTILKSTGNATWTPETSGTPNELRAIFGTSATDVWVVGDGVVLHSDGGGTWTAVADGVPTDVNLRAIGGRPGGPVWAVGNAWTIVRRDTAAWVVEPTGLAVDDPAGDVLQAIFAPSAADVFAGGAGQTILHRP